MKCLLADEHLVLLSCGHVWCGSHLLSPVYEVCQKDIVQPLTISI